MFDLNIYNEGKKRLEKILEKSSQNYYVMTIYGQKLWLREQNAQAASDIFNNILKLNHRDFRSLAYLAEIYINAYKNTQSSTNSILCISHNAHR